jgi:isopropylmalate/homocitrate/citramalate synthase
VLRFGAKPPFALRSTSCPASSDAHPGGHKDNPMTNDETGARRALAFADRLTLEGAITLSASEAFSRRNLNRGNSEQLEAMRRQTTVHLNLGIPVSRISIMAAFGCNFSGDVAPETVIESIASSLAIASERGASIRDLTLADSMGWCTPNRLKCEAEGHE